MMEPPDQIPSSQRDPWISLRSFTHARIGIGRVGVSVTSGELLQFRMDHAHARDAIYSAMDIDGLTKALQDIGLSSTHIHSKATTRELFIQRPDLGRILSEESKDALKHDMRQQQGQLAIMAADGLSAAAVNDHLIPLLKLLRPMLQKASISLAIVTLIEHGRVAISDEVGSILEADLAVILIGERPGLSSPNSLGAYLTYQPKSGLTDESRNCVSNIRPEGLGYAEAAAKIFYLISQSLSLRLSGVSLKDKTGLLEA